MKKKILYSLFLLVFLFGVTACGNSSKDSNFTMECTTPSEKTESMERQNVIVYNFDKDQYTTGYTITTTQKFTTKELYDEYKKAQEETEKNQGTENVTYHLEADDNAMTLKFVMTLKNLDIEAEKSSKDSFRASAIKKSNEGYGATCVLKGMEIEKLK